MKIRSLRISGFRAFGTATQVVDFSPELTVIWAPNSQGKTSIAEALEFLLSGRISRKELVGSAAREFAGSLRNVHLPDDTPVSVSATVVAQDGTEYQIERTLTADYSARGDCESVLKIDGTPQRDLTALGLQLSEPPLETPILLQHNLRFVLSARPKDRANYFKAILEVSDLEGFRDIVVASGQDLPEPDTHLLTQLKTVLQDAGLSETESVLDREEDVQSAVRTAINEGLVNLLEVAGSSDDLPGLVFRARSELASRREAVFPLRALEFRGELPPAPDAGEVTSALAQLIAVRSAAGLANAALLRLYEAYLALPQDEPGPAEGIDCPLCLTPGGLTRDRVAAIQNVLNETAESREAGQRTQRLIADLGQSIRTLLDRVPEILPELHSWSEEARNERGVQQAALAVLMTSGGSDIVSQWRDAESTLVDRWEAARELLEQIHARLSAISVDDVEEDLPNALENATEELQGAWLALDAATEDYQAAAGRLREHILPFLDQREDVRNLRVLVDLANQVDSIAGQLMRHRRLTQVQDAVGDAVAEIDRAKAHVLDEKYEELADEVVRWWELLRAEEPSYFAGVQRAGTGRRFIDLKAGLSIGDDGADPKERDAVAVFSDSQLNCLGLSAFLARVSREPVGFVLLDDPIQGSDSEHRATFLEYVPETLIQEDQQVIVLTHDERLSTNLQERYAHRDIRVYSVLLDDPAEGVQVEQTRDTFDELLARVGSIRRREDLFSRKLASGLLRDAAERFCKLLLVREARDEGRVANLYDHDGKTLGPLVGEVQALLTADPSHPGKLRVVENTTNPGNHDDAAPSGPELRGAYGDLKKLGQVYL